MMTAIQTKFGFTVGQTVEHEIKKVQTYLSPEATYQIPAVVVGFTENMVVIEFATGQKKVTYPKLLRAANHG